MALIAEYRGEEHQELVKKAVVIERSVVPDPETVESYQEHYRRYRSMCAGVRHIYHHSSSGDQHVGIE